MTRLEDELVQLRALVAELRAEGALPGVPSRYPESRRVTTRPTLRLIPGGLNGDESARS